MSPMVFWVFKYTSKIYSYQIYLHKKKKSSKIINTKNSNPFQFALITTWAYKMLKSLTKKYWPGARVSFINKLYFPSLCQTFSTAGMDGYNESSSVQLFLRLETGCYCAGGSKAFGVVDYSTDLHSRLYGSENNCPT